MAYLIGCDPEVFVQNPNSGAFVNAHDMIPGTKANPFKVPSGAVQVDGMALEFNIDPAATSEQFIHNIKTVYHELSTMVPGYNLAQVPYVEFEQEYYNMQPESSKELGCEPDFNAYTGVENPRPDGSVNARSAAGHIHIGWTDGVNPMDPAHFADCCAVVKELDWYLGANSLLWDPDIRRRQLYGKAGAFRPKPYGVEYRVLSNAWLNSEHQMKFVFDATQQCMRHLEAGERTLTNDFYPAPGYLDYGFYSKGDITDILKNFQRRSTLKEIFPLYKAA